MASRTAPPPPEEAAPAASPAVRRRRAPLTAAPRRAPTGRVTRPALVASVVLHLALAVGILLLPVVRRPRPAPAPPPEAVQYLDIAAFPDAGVAADPSAAPGRPAGEPLPTPPSPADTASARPAPPLAFPARVPRGVAPAPAGGGAAPVAGAGGTGPAGGIPRGAAGGRLGAGLGDRRLIVRPGEQVERPRTDAERYRDRLTARLGAVNDSIVDAADRRRRQRNWTVRDGGGREWGLGEDGTAIIAGRKLPIPLPLPVIPRDRDADNAERERVRRWGEIQDQAETEDRDAVLRERAGETRRRVDNERRRRRGETAADTARRAP